MVRKLTRALAVMILAAATLVGIQAAPASAAYPTCNTTRLHSETYSGITFRWRLPSAGTDIVCVLRQGVYNNDAVKQLQMHLNECYNQRIKEDGDYGPATRQAVANAQTWERVVRGRSVRTDGVYGPETMFAMTFVSNFHGTCMRLDGTIAVD